MSQNDDGAFRCSSALGVDTFGRSFLVKPLPIVLRTSATSVTDCWGWPARGDITLFLAIHHQMITTVHSQK